MGDELHGDDFISMKKSAGKAKPSWHATSERIGGITPREVYTRDGMSRQELDDRSSRNRTTIEPTEEQRARNRKDIESLWVSAREKDDAAYNSPPNSDTIVDLPYSEKKKQGLRPYAKEIRRKR